MKTDAPAPRHITGPLNIYTVQSVHRNLLFWLTQREPLVVDLAGVEACDAAGLQLLISLVSTPQVTCTLLHLPQPVTEAIALAGLESFFSPFCPQP